MEWEEEQEEDDPCDLGGPGHYRGMLASDGEGPDCPCSRASLANWNVWVHGVQEGPPPHPTPPPHPRHTPCPCASVFSSLVSLVHCHSFFSVRRFSLKEKPQQIAGVSSRGVLLQGFALAVMHHFLQPPPPIPPPASLHVRFFFPPLLARWLAWRAQRNGNPRLCVPPPDTHTPLLHMASLPSV